VGIDVCGKTKRISYASSHNRRVVTDDVHNPVVQVVGDLPVISIFRRVKTGDSARDGNPLIYALKRKYGYSLQYSCAVELREVAMRIIAKIVTAIGPCDAVIPMPSSSNVAGYVAKSLARGCPNGLASIPRFRKATVADALARMKPLQNVDPKLRRDYGAQLRNMRRLPSGTLVQMKIIDPHIRHLIPAVVPLAPLQDLSGRRIVLVDDLLSTGSTLLSAREHLSTVGPTKVIGVCLLSSLDAFRIDVVKVLTEGR
jgi:phosphoribosylpyrophosphate synthetase